MFRCHFSRRGWRLNISPVPSPAFAFQTPFQKEKTRVTRKANRARMYSRILRLLLVVGAFLASSAAAQQHTAIYTTTLINNDAPQFTTTVIVTLLMPREQPDYPKDGAPVTGTAISHFTATQSGSISTWSATTELFWTLSGNIPLGVDSTIPALPQGARTTLTSVYTTIEYRTSDMYGVWISKQTYKWFSTIRVTLVEAVGTAYPATIIRTGYTHLDATMVGGNPAVSSTYRETGTASYWRTTTMVQATAQP